MPSHTIPFRPITLTIWTRCWPEPRMRRNRQTDWSRRLVRENTLTVDDSDLADLSR